MNDYERIAKVIRYLDECRDRQPDLRTAADQLGLSPFHFHRLFRRWAGITPKSFVECLTLRAAKEALRDGHSVLETAIASGLSGPGRLHDLLIKWEAVTPGEFRQKGAGLEIRYGFGTTPFGRCLIAQTKRGISHFAFVPEGSELDSESEALTELR